MTLSRGSFNNKRKKKSGTSQLTFVLGGTGILFFVAVIAVVLHLMRSPSQALMRAEPAQLQIITADILVPIETIQVGVALQSTMFRKEPKAEEQITGDMIRSTDELKGMYSRGVLFRGQPVLKAALTNKQPVHVLTALLPKGYRAIALEVERPLLDNVDGWAQPGTDVDVVWITPVFGREMAAILAGPVRILASNKATEWTASKPPGAQPDKLVTVTLLVTVRDAVRISLAAMHGKISLGLRGLADKRPNEGSRPLSTIVDESPPKENVRSVLSVKVTDPQSQGSEVRKYDLSGRRVTE